jgi:hypothetical protein
MICVRIRVDVDGGCQQKRRLFKEGDVGSAQRACCFDPGSAAADHEDTQVAILAVDHGLVQLGEYLDSHS